MVELVQFQVNERIDSDNFHAVATIKIPSFYHDTLDSTDIFIHGQYNARGNTFWPTILGDENELEDYYDEIQTLVEGR
jgi:hypothetical protein